MRQFAGLSYEQAVREYSQTVFSVCVMRLQNTADAEDCYQNVFAKLYYKSPEFSDSEHLKAWLIRVAVNECKNYIRKNRRALPIDCIREQAVEFDTSGIDMSWALMKTPPKYREVLYLYYGYNYKVSEIAAILKLNENTVKTRLNRGRKLLKEIYGGDNNG
ncbi:MAG: sigma-70 family RNA polymerase sigma factor [Ruminococcus sp.]|nr:sigma-70 family RNA polymerase sigma factor [Ruminococcus sp.]